MAPDGIGRQTEKVFSRLGIKTVAQLHAVPKAYLEETLGKNAAASFHEQAFGIASAAVVSGRRRKSISRETTFEEDVKDQGVLHDVLRRLAADVAAATRREGVSGTVVTLKIRFEGFETYTRRHKLAEPTHDEHVILREAWGLLRRSKLPCKAVRLIGVGVSSWAQAASAQVDLFSPPQVRERDERLLETIDRVAARFGKGTLLLGCTAKSNRRKPR